MLYITGEDVTLTNRFIKALQEMCYFIKVIFRDPDKNENNIALTVRMDKRRRCKQISQLIYNAIKNNKYKINHFFDVIIINFTDLPDLEYLSNGFDSGIFEDLFNYCQDTRGLYVIPNFGSDIMVVITSEDKYERYIMSANRLDRYASYKHNSLINRTTKYIEFFDKGR